MNEIDQDLYSRQIYVLGNQAMVKLTKAKVLLHSIGSLGVEIAKNLILAGIGSLTIVDTNTCSLSDLSGQFFINQDQVDSKLNRCDACYQELKNLNPYVQIECLNSNKDFQDENFLKNFNCVILTEMENFEHLKRINKVCRENGVNFILANTFGLFGYSFVDFGNEFQVLDADGEEYRDVFILKITRNSIEQREFLVETLDQRCHNLEVGDLFKITEIEGFENDQVFKVSKVLNSYKFVFESDMEGEYKRGGIFRKLKQKLTIEFKSLEDQLEEPDLIFSDLNQLKFLNPKILHLLNKNYDESLSYQEFADILETPSDVDKENFKTLSRTFYDSKRCKYSPYSSIFGGIVAQECLKSVTNKFVPIKQWLYLDTADIYESASFTPKHDRYDELRICFGGEDTVNKLFKTRLFMVGCGAIGCEMLKNYALLGLGKEGEISITDNDLIEKSNLSRQFLFRAKDIQRPKSVVAAEAALKINSDVKIKTFESKVCPQTEGEFNDKFFQRQDVMVNALDNLEARRYMDSRCVSNQKPLIESGTLGAKGHVQVVLPYLTESYNSQKDPNDGEGEVPYCTLKSFPSNIEHCIQWSRDKFESIFKIKPNLYNKFIEKHRLNELTNQLKETNEPVEDLFKFCKYIRSFCFDYSDCLRLARSKFEKYFSNKAKDILHIYPSDHLMSDSSPFWKLPKRQPTPIRFDINDELHFNFVKSLARLLSEVYGLKVNDEDDNYFRKVLETCEVAEWRPRKKHIETDESKKKTQDAQDNSEKELTNSQCVDIIEKFVQKSSDKKLEFIDFEKDNDSNGHVDFIHATSNLRARMYALETTDKLQVKKIAGKIVPAIATTTSVIAGLATIELIKVIQQNWKFDKFRNTFLNLGISLFLLSEPGPCPKTKITDECFVTLWDKWSINGTESFTLKQFIEAVKKKYKLTISGVMYGSKSIYIPVMPGHAKRLNEKMLKLLKGVTSLSALTSVSSDNYCDLYLTYEECDNDSVNRDKNNLCPPIRYFYN